MRGMGMCEVPLIISMGGGGGGLGSEALLSQLDTFSLGRFQLSQH